MTEVLDLLMFVAVCGALLCGFPVAFTLGGVALIFAVLGMALGVFELAFLSALPQRIFGTMTNEVLVAVPLFVFMGVMLERSRLAEELLETMSLLFGRLRGGLGLSVTVVGAMMAASTGIVGATVVTMGLLSLPTMLRRGYDPRLAAGSICAAGTLGQIIPPSIVLVLLGDVISNSYQQAQLAAGNFAPDTVSVGDLFAGALLPGLMLVGLYMIYQVAVAVVRPAAAPALPPEELTISRAELGRRVISALIPPLVLILAVLGSILGGIATPTEAAALGAVGAILLAGQRLVPQPGRAIVLAGLATAGLLLLNWGMDLRVGRSFIPTADAVGIVMAVILSILIMWGLVVGLLRSWRTGVLMEVMHSTMEISAMVFVILIGAGLFSIVFRGFGGDESVHEMLSALPGGVVGAVVAVMAVMFLLGFFLDFIEIVFVVVPVVAPVLLQMGLDPIWLGVMMAVNLQTSFLTPPFGFALFYLRGVAPESVSTMDIYRGAVPFVLIQLLALVLLAALPGLATWLPAALYG